MFWWEGFEHMLCHIRFLFMGRHSSRVRELRVMRDSIAFWKSSPVVQASGSD
jgi:hypothetical protein